MNPDVVHFLPAVVLGVFRFDDEISSVSLAPEDLRDEAYQQFIKRKRRFLPYNVETAIQRLQTADTVQSYERHQSHIKSAVKKSAKSKTRAKLFFQRHGEYFANAINGTELIAEEKLGSAENYLEIQFVHNVLAPVLNDNGLMRVKPQHEVGGYRLDFALQIGQAPKLAIEIDGFGKFTARENLDAFLERQNYIVRNHWTLLRYSYSQIITRPNDIIEELHSILRADSGYGDILAVSVPQHTVVANGVPRDAGWGVVHLVNDFYRIQNSFADRMLGPWRDRDTLVLKDDFGFDLPFVALAISDRAIA